MSVKNKATMTGQPAQRLMYLSDFGISPFVISQRAFEQRQAQRRIQQRKRRQTYKEAQAFFAQPIEEPKR